MSDISNQLIKDSYNYVLQSDLVTGIVYRIGGVIPVNPIFQSGLTVNGSFTYSNGTEQLGYVMTCDAFGNANWAPASAATPSSGVTSITATNGLSGNVTTGAVTIVNTAPDRTVTITGGTNIEITGTYPDFGVNFTGSTTGGTTIQGITGITGTSGVSANTTDYGTTIINTAPDRTVTITGGTNIQITGTYPDFGVNFTGSTTGGTVSGDYLSLSGGTVTGGTIFQSGLTANTISATTYLNLPVSAVTNGTGISASTSNGTVTITNIAPDQTVTISGGTGITTGGTYPNFTLVNSAPDQTVTISGGTGITTGGTYPNFTIVNSAPDRTVTLTGGTNIQITGTYPDFGVNYTGTTIVQGITGITGTSGVSASTTNYVTTITNTAPDQTVTISGGTGITTGGTYPNFTILNSAPDQTVTITGGTNMQIIGTYPNFGINFTGSTGTSGEYLPLSGGTVTGATIFQSGLTANTISATTYLNLPSIGGLEYFVTGATPTATQSGDRWFNTDTGVELVWIEDGDSNQWVQPFSVPGPLSPDVGYYATTGITTGQTLTWDKTYWGISGSSNVNLTLPTTTSKDGYYLIVKDEAGICGTYRIRITPASGLIDGNNYIDMNINYMSLTLMVRGGNWYLI
jgi:hypothetical protein